MLVQQVSEGKSAVIAGLPEKLKPLSHMLNSQKFIGGDQPLFADYIVFGALQWARISSATQMLPEGDVVTDWFNRCLDLHDGIGRSVSSAAE